MSPETAPLEGTRLLVAISNAIVGLLRETSGKGPRRCSTQWAGRDVLVVLLEGGFTAAERTLYDAGEGAAARAARQALQDVLEPRMTGIVEELTGQAVSVCMSAIHQDPDYQLEAFLLAGAVLGATP